MKINTLKTIIASILAALIAYMYWALCNASEPLSLKILLICMGFLSLLITFCGAFGMDYVNTRQGVNLKVLSWCFSFVLIALHTIIALAGIDKSLTIIATGLLVLVYILLFNTINHLKM